MWPLLTFWYYSHVEKEQLAVTYVRYFHRYPSLTCTARVTWQPSEASVVTCHRSSFRKLFFLLQKRNLPTSRLLLPPIGYTRQPQRSDWPDRGHVCARHNQTTPPTFKSFMCNWYRPRRKKRLEFQYFGGREMKVGRESAIKVSLWKRSRAPRRLGLFFGQVTTFKLAAKDLSRCPLSVMLLIYTIQYHNSVL